MGREKCKKQDGFYTLPLGSWPTKRNGKVKNKPSKANEKVAKNLRISIAMNNIRI